MIRIIQCRVWTERAARCEVLRRTEQLNNQPIVWASYAKKIKKKRVVQRNLGLTMSRISIPLSDVFLVRSVNVNNIWLWKLQKTCWFIPGGFFLHPAIVGQKFMFETSQRSGVCGLTAVSSIILFPCQCLHFALLNINFSNLNPLLRDLSRVDIFSTIYPHFPFLYLYHRPSFWASLENASLVFLTSSYGRCLVHGINIVILLCMLSKNLYLYGFISLLMITLQSHSCFDFSIPTTLRCYLSSLLSEPRFKTFHSSELNFINHNYFSAYLPPMEDLPVVC